MLNFSQCTVLQKLAKQRRKIEIYFFLQKTEIHSLPAGLILYFSDHRTNSVQYYSEVEQQFKGIKLPVIL